MSYRLHNALQCMAQVLAGFCIVKYCICMEKVIISSNASPCHHNHWISQSTSIASNAEIWLGMLHFGKKHYIICFFLEYFCWDITQCHREIKATNTQKWEWEGV